MTVFFFHLMLIAGGGLLSCVLARKEKISAFAGAAGILAGSLGGLATVLGAMLGGQTCKLESSWPLPIGSISAGIDQLSALFLCAIFGLAALGAIYGPGYMPRTGKNPGDRLSWLWLSLLVVAMALVVTARNAILFLLAWELMSLSSFFLVAFENGQEKVRRAAWTYLVATHLGTAFLLLMFILMGAVCDSFEFDSFAALRTCDAGLINLLFLLGLVGFGTKAGFYPLHVWLPEAHPAAPSHVSALMSGVMIKTGIYALMRLVALIGPPPEWWGWVIVAVGVASGILGVVFALAQHDLKRLLAYHSVENIGIIAIGFGLGLLGWSHDKPLIMLAGFAGSLLHVMNHAAFKGLLFLAAGAVLHATNCRDMEKLGGLLKKMPVTGAAFFSGSVAICGLPPLNGFVSELLIYVAALACILQSEMGAVLPGLTALGALALIGGLAAACFAKAFGVVFLGEPRSPEAARAHECGWGMRWPMVVLALTCLAIAFLAPFIMPPLSAAVMNITALAPARAGTHLELLGTILARVATGSVAFLSLLCLLAFARLVLLRGRAVGRQPTWDCGYAKPSARMQYTASSFAQPVTHMFRGALHTKMHGELPQDFFPKSASFSTHAEDAAHRYLFAPLFRYVDRAMDCLRWIQEGRVQVYVLYITVTLLVLLLAAL